MKLEGKVMVGREAILKWFTGKARANADIALTALAESEAKGEWIPKAGRSVRAALDKANVARNLAKTHGKALEAIGDYRTPREKGGYAIAFMLGYGGRDPIDFAAIREAAPDRLKAVVDRAKEFADAMRPAWELVDKLDATRPEPVFTYLGASRTVTATLTFLGVAGNTATTRMCPIEWTLETRVKDGKAYYVKVGRLLWPEGTVHGTSRYDHRTYHCEACGHAIRNLANWIPLLIDDEVGVPHSLWVGRDCARTIFGIEVKGEVEIREAAK